MELEGLKGKNVSVRCLDARYSGTLLDFDDETLTLQSSTTVAIPWNSVIYLSSHDRRYEDRGLKHRHLVGTLTWIGFYALVIGVGAVLWLLLRWYL